MRLRAVAVSSLLVLGLRFARSHRQRLSMSAKAGAAANLSAAGGASARIEATDEPVIVQMQRRIAGRDGLKSLAQGVVYWTPPAEALEAAARAVADPHTSQYGADNGMPELRERLRQKLREENGLVRSEVQVTAGANQAFMNVVVALADPGDKVGLGQASYFNHAMALQMTGLSDDIVHYPLDAETMEPDLDWLAQRQASDPLKMLVLTNPCNPTGVVLSRAKLERISALCAAHGTWLVLDNTYEYFTFGDEAFHCLEGDHVVNIFSFSKAYGAMGWRCGYIAYPPHIETELLKVQDTVPICAPVISQKLALACLDCGRPWVERYLPTLRDNMAIVRGALESGLAAADGAKVFGGDGAIYLFCRLPAALADDARLTEALALEHGVVVIPGSSCNMPGYIRVAFANLDTPSCREAAARLEAGLAAELRDAQGG